jgi:Xaa-Pro dipeptidase
MEKHHLDALIAAAPPNVNYLSNYGALSYESVEGSYVFVVFSADRNQEPTLIVPLVKAAELVSTKMSWIKDVRTYGTFYVTVPEGQRLSGWEAELVPLFRNQRDSDPFEVLQDVLGEKKLIGRNVGIDERAFRGSEYDRLCKQLGGGDNLTMVSEIFKEIRMVKTQDEIDIILEANRITEVGVKVVMESIRPGWTTMDAVRLYGKTVSELDALPMSPTITFGKNGYLPNSYFISSKQPMSQGDLIRFDVTCIYKGHYTDIGRNAVVGSASIEQRKLFDVAYSGEEEAINAARPGVRASEIFQKGVEGARKAGMPGYNRVHCGHGIALELYEHPLITPTCETVVEEGTVINIETPYYEIGGGAYIVEDTLVVTTGEPIFASRMDRGLFEIAA